MTGSAESSICGSGAAGVIGIIGDSKDAALSAEVGSGFGAGVGSGIVTGSGSGTKRFEEEVGVASTTGFGAEGWIGG